MRIVYHLIGNGFVDELEAAILAYYRESVGRAITIEEAILTRRALYAIHRREMFRFSQCRRTDFAIRGHATRRTGRYWRIISNELYEDHSSDNPYGRLRPRG